MFTDNDIYLRTEQMGVCWGGGGRCRMWRCEGFDYRPVSCPFHVH